MSLPKFTVWITSFTWANIPMKSSPWPSKIPSSSIPKWFYRETNDKFLFVKRPSCKTCFASLCRRMCPLMSIAFEDLKPRRFYAVLIDFVLMDAFKYSYNGTSNRWEANSPMLPEENWPRLYLHPSTPATGASLMQNALTFKTLKLTNCPVTAANSTQVSNQMWLR